MEDAIRGARRRARAAKRIGLRRRADRVFVGPTSPLGAAELKAKPVGEIVEYLKGWVPEGGFMAPSREGAGRALTEAVAADPARFVAAIQRFRECDSRRRSGKSISIGRVSSSPAA